MQDLINFCVLIKKCKEWFAYPVREGGWIRHKVFLSLLTRLVVYSIRGLSYYDQLTTIITQILAYRNKVYRIETDLSV